MVTDDFWRIISGEPRPKYLVNLRNWEVVSERKLRSVLITRGRLSITFVKPFDVGQVHQLAIQTWDADLFGKPKKSKKVLYVSSY